MKKVQPLHVIEVTPDQMSKLQDLSSGSKAIPDSSSPYVDIIPSTINDHPITDVETSHRPITASSAKIARKNNSVSVELQEIGADQVGNVARLQPRLCVSRVCGLG